MLADIFQGKEFVFIAEIGLNHNGDPDLALSMISEAKRAGADAVKFQTFIPEYMNSIYSSSLLKYGEESQPDSSIIDFFKKFSLKKEDYLRLRDFSRKVDIEFFSSPFDAPSVDLLEEMNVRLYKIASSEVTNYILLEKISKTRKPVIMSTGISTEDEISGAIELLLGNGTPEIILMHCVSLYPAPEDKSNLNRISELRKRFNLEIGYSDHTIGYRAIELASILGVKIFEKHFKFDNIIDCPDKEVSLDANGFKMMISSIKEKMNILGSGNINYGPAEETVARSARRSLFAKRDIPKGKILERDDIIPKRPGIGIPVYQESRVVGKKAKFLIKEDYLIKEEYFE